MIQFIVTMLGLAAFLFWWWQLIELRHGMSRLKFLRNAPLWPRNAAQPRVTVIVPACNEERNIAEALQSLLAQDYENFEVLVLDDRSTDGTGRILDEMAKSHPRLRVAHIRRLRRGWLGKNHALWIGAARSSGEWLLFTDADVVMTPGTLSRAMAFARRRRLDHLTISPEMIGGSFGLKVAVGAFAMFFAIAMQPWRASDPRSRAFIGIGAFNLVRRQAYFAVDGHRRIRLRPDDDVRLGQILKRGGFRQEMAQGAGSLRVEWYQTLGEFVRGLEKNMFAGAQYKVSFIAAGTALMLALWAWPFAALLLTSGPEWWLYLGAILPIMVMLLGKMLMQRENPLAALAFPIGVLILVFTMWRSTALALWRGGITWRGTFYPLRALRRNKI